jgi:hypothetical protein
MMTRAHKRLGNRWEKAISGRCAPTQYKTGPSHKLLGTKTKIC